MPESPIRETAEIIPFPARSRGGKASLRGSTRQVVEQAPVAVCDYGSSWYHDAAMQEEVRKHPPR